MQKNLNKKQYKSNKVVQMKTGNDLGFSRKRGKKQEGFENI